MAKYEGVTIGGPADGQFLNAGMPRLIIPGEMNKLGNFSEDSYSHLVVGDGTDEKYGVWVHSSLTLAEAVKHVFQAYSQPKAAVKASRREQELLEANNRYLEEAREARASLATWRATTEGIGAVREKKFAACREERDELRRQLAEIREEGTVIRTALESRGYHDPGIILSAVVLRALIDLDKALQRNGALDADIRIMENQLTDVRAVVTAAGYRNEGMAFMGRLRMMAADLKKLQADAVANLTALDAAKQEIEEVRGVLRSTGPADTGRPMESLVDSAIDRERTRHEATLDLLAKELGQEWATLPGRDGRKDYAGYAAFLRERIRCDYTRNDAVDRMLGKIAQAIRLPHAWKAGTPASDRVDDLVQHIAEWNSYPPQGATEVAFVKTQTEARRDAKRQFMWESGAAPSTDIDPSKIVPPIWNVLAERITNIEQRVEALDEAIPQLIESRIAKTIDRIENVEKNLPKWIDERVAKAVASHEKRHSTGIKR